MLYSGNGEETTGKKSEGRGLKCAEEGKGRNKKTNSGKPDDSEKKEREETE